MTTKTKRLQVIERQLADLRLGDEDTRADLLRERNQLLGGDPNKTAEELAKEYYAPLVGALRSSRTA